MSSRQEEKEQRRLEREQAEAAERASAGRRKRLSMVLGGLVGLLVLAAAGYAISQALGGDDKKAGGKSVKDAANVKLPDPEITDLKEAASAAGCKLENPKYEGAGHEERKFTTADYKTNPPTSGTHFPTWYDDGIYDPGSVPELGQLVHTLEHGRINIQYKKGTPKATVDKLEAFAAEKTGYHLLLYENTTDMDAQVAATAWTHLLTCATYNDKVIDAFRTFYQEYVDKGPENVP
jgi:hypothetical protein